MPRRRRRPHHPPQWRRRQPGHLCAQREGDGAVDAARDADDDASQTRLRTVRAEQGALGLQHQGGIKAAPTTKQRQGPVQTGGGGDGSGGHAAG